MNEKKRPGKRITLQPITEILGAPNEETATEVEISQIHSFKNHPFKVLDDEKMDELVESIKENGIITPVLLRPVGEDEYEMISGHRRLHGAELVGLTMIPAIIRELTDDDATILMVNSNIQREELLPSEKAFAYKMKMDAMSRQGHRSDLTCAQNGHKYDGMKSRDIIAEEAGISKNQVSRYIRLTELIPELLDLVDSKRLQFTVAVDISYISKEIQVWINEYIHDNGCIKSNQIAALRESLMSGAMTQGQMISLFNNCIPGRLPAEKLVLSEKKYRKYFPPHYTVSDMESLIEKLLIQWNESQEEQS